MEETLRHLLQLPRLLCRASFQIEKKRPNRTSQSAQTKAELPSPPSYRERALSSDFASALCNNQLECSLLKLPLELREIIYKEVLGGYVFHVGWRPRRMGHMRCESASMDACEVKGCYKMMGYESVCYGGFGINRGLLGLLLTCRRIYLEAVNILYSTNSFSFTNPSALRLLTCTILPQRRAAIRVLHLYWSVHPYSAPGARILHPFVPQEEAIWEEFCRVVREELTGLKEIRVWIKRGGRMSNKEAETKMLVPLREVKGVDNVEVKFPWHRDEGVENDWRKIASP